MDVPEAKDRAHDVVLYAKLDEKRILAHRDVLSNSSSFFEAMFTSGIIETNEIVLHDIPGFMLSAVVRYCYTGDLTIDNVEILAEAAHIFELDDKLLGKCLKFMSKNLCVENCMDFVLIAEKHNLKEFLQLSMDFIDPFFDSFLQHDTFYEISFKTLRNILMRNTLEVSNEKSIFDAILKWYKYDKLNRRKYLPELMKVVRISDLERTFITSFFLDFCAYNDCVDVLQAAHEYLAQDVNAVHKKSTRRLSDRIVVFNDEIIQVYSEKTKNWTELTYEEGGKLRNLTFEYRWLEGIDYYSLMTTTTKKYLDTIKKINLATRKMIFERKFLSKSTRIIDAKWVEGDNSKLYVLGYKKNNCETDHDKCSQVLSCFQYDLKEEAGLWATLPHIISLQSFFHTVFVDGYLYVVDGKRMCRYSDVEAKWEECPPMQIEIDQTEFGVAVVNSCIYVVGNTTIWRFKQFAQCFNPATLSWKLGAFLDEPCKNIRVCGTNRFIYLFNGDRATRVFRYDPEVDQWKKLESIHSMTGDFNLFNASNYY